MTNIERLLNRLKDISFIAREVFPTNGGTWEDIVKMMGRIADEGITSVPSSETIQPYKNGFDDLGKLQAGAPSLLDGKR
jgi:hypothetical protein